MQVVLRSEVIPFLRSQHPPPPQLSEDQLRTIQSDFERLLSKHVQMPMPDEEIARRMREQQESIQEMVEFLERWKQD